MNQSLSPKGARRLSLLRHPRARQDCCTGQCCRHELQRQGNGQNGHPLVAASKSSFVKKCEVAANG